MIAVDLADVPEDDALLDTLGGRNGDALITDELNVMLLGWRRDVDADPASVLVDTDTAVAVIEAARRPADLLPQWAHTAIYVAELALPVLVFVVLPLVLSVAQEVTR